MGIVGCNSAFCFGHLFFVDAKLASAVKIAYETAGKPLLSDFNQGIHIL